MRKKLTPSEIYNAYLESERRRDIELVTCIFCDEDNYINDLEDNKWYCPICNKKDSTLVR